MATPKVFESEYRCCLILWEHEPVSRAELAKLCRQQLGFSSQQQFSRQFRSVTGMTPSEYVKTLR